MDSPSATVPPEQLQRIHFFAGGHAFRLGSLRNLEEFYALDPSVRFNSKRYLVPRALALSENGGEGEKKSYFRNATLLNALDEEVRGGFVRANHQFELNCKLPFNEEL